MSYQPQDSIIVLANKNKGYILKKLENDRYLIVYRKNNKSAIVREFAEKEFILDKDDENNART